ncbi:MAG: iron chelate uptake ABC transporter family permease subunit [Planctomycetota bacterium]|jgi:zinc/manganese transport system permease protein|nr:iron chelate uptake ABC transporter family permease subunit [Planctomycetota bacterium]MDP6764305.1 iron chelate uptake ABC transporter family permease subunit [Planctomycetota bacterium]
MDATQALSTMAWPLAACLVLTGIHVHLGIHVLARKVIFVDLALAQIAALGAVWAVLAGWDLHEDPWVVRGFSLLFTTIGAAVFAGTRMRHERVPHEAIIGVTYAVALAATLLASARLPHGTEEMRELLAGSILWVESGTVLVSAALYLAVGAAHFAFRSRLALISEDADAARAAGLSVRAWDFFFYFSFGLVVTSSVAIAGVLLVFSYLVIPAVIAALFCRGVGARLVVGWAVGAAVSVVGLVLSYQHDLPSGPSVVVSFGAVLALAGIVHHVRGAAKPGPAALKSVGSVAAIALLLVGSASLRKDEHAGLRDQLKSPHASIRRAALEAAAADPVLWPVALEVAGALLADEEPELRARAVELVCRNGAADQLAAVRSLLTDPDDLVREAALQCVRRLHDEGAVESLLAAAAVESDEFLAVEMAEGLCEFGRVEGLALLMDSMDTAGLAMARRDAWEHLHAHTDLEEPFDASDAADSPANDAALAVYRAWLERHRAQLVWDGPSGHFRVPAEAGR